MKNNRNQQSQNLNDNRSRNQSQEVEFDQFRVPLSQMQNSTDERLMRYAISLARRGVGTTGANPSVGCVIAKLAGADSDCSQPLIMGVGTTATGGRPHSETQALSMAMELFGAAALSGATAYVTLEPCCHQGQTPPCSDSLIAAGIGRVVIGAIDPDPRMAGKGVMALQAAHISVTVGILEAECLALHQSFFKLQLCSRPSITLKLATSLDGKIATASGESQWISSALARDYGHLLRARHQAIMVGTATALHDQPRLDCRLPGMANYSPQRIILDRELKLPPNYFMRLEMGPGRSLPLLLVTSLERFSHPDCQRVIDSLQRQNIEIIPLPPIETQPTRLDLAALMQELGRRGIQSLLVEGGGTIAGALLAAELVDRLVIFRAPLLLGETAQSAIKEWSAATLTEGRVWQLDERIVLPPDLFESYSKRS